jgi:HPt (histidine-containing phosphotransfer) domain-containing protein
MKKLKSTASSSLLAYDVENTPVLDSNHLMNQCENSLEYASQAIEEFLATTHTDLEEMDRAISCGDIARIASMAYRISNGAATVGAKQTQVITKALEKSCRNGQYESLPLHVSQFRQGCQRLQDAVDHLAETPS